MTTVDEVTFEDDLQAVLATEEAKRWILERGNSLEVLVQLSPISKPEEVFLARFSWVSYPGSLPSLKFRNLTTRLESDRAAWPMLPGFRPQSLDSCVHWTAEGHKLHEEWARGSATKHDPAANVLFRSLCFLQDELDHNYNGRAAA